MALIRWTPARDPFAFQNDLNRLFEEVLGVSRSQGPVAWHPAVDVEEHPEGFTIRTELPGMKLEDVKITFEESALRAVAQKALKRGTGARGLRAILEESLLDVMFDLPTREDVVEVKVIESCITNGAPPLLEIAPKRQKKEA